MKIYPDAYFKKVEDINIEFLNKNKEKLHKTPIYRKTKMLIFGFMAQKYSSNTVDSTITFSMKCRYLSFTLSAT